MTEQTISDLELVKACVAEQRRPRLVREDIVREICRRIMKSSNDLVNDSEDYRIGQWSGAEKVMSDLDAHLTTHPEKDESRRIEQLERELAEARKVYSAERHHLRTVNENLIRHLSHIHGLVHPDYIALPDGRKMKFHPPDELVREAWEGLSKAIREIPQVIDAVRAGQSKEASA